MMLRYLLHRVIMGDMHNEGVPLHSNVMPIFGRRAMLLNAENSGIPAAM